MSAELTEVTRERMYNVMKIGELKAQLTKQKQATENCEAMLSRMVEERNAAIAQEEEARSAHRHELIRMKAKLDKTKYLKDLYVKRRPLSPRRGMSCGSGRTSYSWRSLSWHTI